MDRLSVQFRFVKLFNQIKELFAGGRSRANLKLAEDERLDPFNPFPEPITIEITDVIDLHTIQPKDVKRVVEEYLEQVHQSGFRSVRIIHGKGIGVQRRIVRSVLSETPFVDNWTDAPRRQEGWAQRLSDS